MIAKCRAAGLILVLGPVFLALLCDSPTILAQEGIEAYDRGFLAQAWNELQEAKLNLDELDFLRSAMTTDADSALEIYRQVVLRSPESPIARRAADRIRQYYYAQGLYQRAEEMGESLGDWKPPQRRLRQPESTPPPPFVMSSTVPPLQVKAEPEVEDEPIETEPERIEIEEKATKTFSLQVGAFSNLANARSLKADLEKAGYQVIILDPSDNPTDFHVVWVTGFESVSDAFSAAEAIQTKFNHQPIVIPNDKEE